MKIVLTVAGLTQEFDGFSGLAGKYRELVTVERNLALAASTIKEQRFHQGKAIAYAAVADQLSAAEVF